MNGDTPGTTYRRSAGHLQTAPDADVVADSVDALRALYGDAVEDPVASWVTHWGQDPYSEGSYSHLPIGASHHDHDALAGPFEGGLRFAGEATWGEEPATVGGAYASGRRTAQSILGREIDLADFAAAIVRRERETE